MRYFLMLGLLAGCTYQLPPEMTYNDRLQVYDRMRFGGGGNQMYQEQPYTMQVPYQEQSCRTINGVIYC